MRWLALSGFIFIACGPEAPLPVEVRVHLLGRAKVFQPVGGVPEPRLEVGDELRLLMEPASLEPGRCDPFNGGSLELNVRDPDQKVRQASVLSLTSTLVTGANGSYLLETLPFSPSEAARSPAKPVQLPDTPGRWTLEFTWRCHGDEARPQSDALTFWSHQNRRSTPFWREHQELLEADPSQDQVVAYVDLLSRTHSAEHRMWLLDRLFQAHKNAGDNVQAEKYALEWVDTAHQAGFPSEAVRAWNGAHEAARNQFHSLRAKKYLDASFKLLQDLDYQVRLPESWQSRCILLEWMDQPLEALEACSEARLHADRVGKHDVRVRVDLFELYLLQRLGHHPLVNRRLLEMLESSDPEDAYGLNHLAWLLLLGAEAGVPIHGSQQDALTRAGQLFEKSRKKFDAGGRIAEAANQLAGLAEVAVMKGDAAAADVALGGISQGLQLSNEEVKLSVIWTRGHQALLVGDFSGAYAQFKALEREAGVHKRGDFIGMASFGMGEALRAMKRPLEADRAYMSALSASDDSEAVRSPLHRGAMLTSNALWEAKLIQLRLDRDDILSALEAVEQIAWKCRQALGGVGRTRDLSAADRTSKGELEAKITGIDRELTQIYRRRPLSQALADQRVRLEGQRQQAWAALAMSSAASASEAGLSMFVFPRRRDAATSKWWPPRYGSTARRAQFPEGAGHIRALRTELIARRHPRLAFPLSHGHLRKTKPRAAAPLTARATVCAVKIRMLLDHGDLPQVQGLGNVGRVGNSRRGDKAEVWPARRHRETHDMTHSP